MISLNWIDFIPETYTPDQFAKWGDVSPNFSVEPGKIYVPGTPMAGNTVVDSFNKGVTHASIHLVNASGETIPQTKWYNDVPRTFEIWGVPDAPFRRNESQSRARGQAVNISSRLWVGETMEGASWLDPEFPEWGWFYQELIARYEAQKAIDGVPYYVAHDYGGPWGNDFYSLGLGGLNEKRAAYTQPKNALPSSFYHRKQQLCNAHFGGVYVNYFDDRDTIYAKIFEMEVAERFGLVNGLFLFPVYEALPGWEHAIYTDNPAGKMGVSDKQPLPASDLMTYAYVAHDWGKALITWGQPHQATRNPNKLAVLPAEWGTLGPGKWRWQRATGSPTNFPFVDYFAEPTFPAAISTKQWDLLHWGIHAHQVSASTWGGEYRYATFRLSSGSWRPRETDGSDVLWAYRDKVGIARVRKQGDYRKIVYLNPYADGIARTIEIQDPWDSNIVYTSSVAGPGIHVANATV